MLTPSLSLPLLAAAQAQKHVTHNEALLRLDRLTQAAATSRHIAAPPAGATDGAAYIVPPDASGTWAGHTGMLAIYDSGAWDFLPAPVGLRVYVEDEGALLIFDGSDWRGISEQTPKLGINATADGANRLAVASSASLFSHSGNGHQLKINKANAADTASMLFQSGFTGHAELGLAGSNSFVMKVSGNGTSWTTAIAIDSATGAVSMPATPRVEMRQLKHAVKTTPFTTTATTPAATGLAVSVTPTGTPCRMRVSGQIVLGADFWFTAPRVAIYRSGTKIWPSGTGYLEHQLLANTSANSGYVSMSCPFTFIDTLAAPGAVTYEIYLATLTAGYASYLNRRHLDTDPRGESFLMVEELSP